MNKEELAQTKNVQNSLRHSGEMLQQNSDFEFSEILAQNDFENMQLQNKKDSLNFEVANALFLMSNTLGEDYENNSDSPFSNDFNINEELIVKILNNNKDKLSVEHKSFLENSNKDIAKCFNNSSVQTQKLIDALMQKYLNGEFGSSDGEFEFEVKQTIEFLKARKKLLELLANKLTKNSRMSGYEAYREVVVIGKHIDEMLFESYENEINTEQTVVNFIEFCRSQTQLKKLYKTQVNNLQKETDNKYNKIAQNAIEEKRKKEELEMQNAIKQLNKNKITNKINSTTKNIEETMSK